MQNASHLIVLSGSAREQHPAASLAAALELISKRVAPPDADGWDYTPDLTVDRILVWENTPEGQRLVWHFSGWHHQLDASDLVPGGLEQGTLPGHDRSLFDELSDNQ